MNTTSNWEERFRERFVKDGVPIGIRKFLAEDGLDVTASHIEAFIQEEKDKSYREGQSSERGLFSVGFNKGEIDFSVNCSVSELTHEQMNELRQMLVVGIGQLESMWRRSQEEGQTDSLLTPNNKEKSKYVCGEDRRPRWVTYDKDGNIIKDDKYEHQDGNFSNMCAFSYCRCQQ